MDFQNRLGAFQDATSQASGNLKSFQDRSASAISENKSLLSAGKSLAQNKVVADLVGGMSLESAIRLSKPSVKKALNWADSKTGGRVSKDTRALKDLIKKKTGFDKFENKIEEAKSQVKQRVSDLKDKVVQKIKGKVNEVTDKVKDASSKFDGDETKSQSVSEDKADRISESKDGNVVRSDEGEGEGKGDDGGEGGEGGDAEIEYPDYVEPPKLVDMSGKGAVPNEPEQTDGIELKDFNQSAEQDSTNLTNEASTTQADIKENATIAEENKSSGADGEKEDDAGDGAGEDTDDALKASSAMTDEDIGEGFTAAGATADSTGIGAIVGVPLEIVGAGLEIAGAVQAGEGIWNWFNDDILGNKAPVKIDSIKLPSQPKTMASQGFQATPNFSSTFDRPHGAGGW